MLNAISGFDVDQIGYASQLGLRPLWPIRHEVLQSPNGIIGDDGISRVMHWFAAELMTLHAKQLAGS